MQDSRLKQKILDATDGGRRIFEDLYPEAKKYLLPVKVLLNSVTRKPPAQVSNLLTIKETNTGYCMTLAMIQQSMP